MSVPLWNFAHAFFTNKRLLFFVSFKILDLTSFLLFKVKRSTFKVKFSISYGGASVAYQMKGLFKIFTTMQESHFYFN